MSVPFAQMTTFAAEARKIREYRAWWATYDPVAYVWLCRAERRGARVPWTDREAADPRVRR
jgi:hypothetical protein